MSLRSTRRTVQCVNEDCPDVGSTGAPWKGQRGASSPTLLAPCPRCSSAVEPVVGAAEEPEAAAPEPPPPTPVVAFPKVFLGVPRASLGEVRVGREARQKLDAMQRSPEHRGRGRTLADLAALVLDRWGRGELDPTGAA